jgi:predicted nucleotidyltransferase component of viral defense system
MIESKFIKAWQEYAPWPLQWQVEQDLIISRVLCELFSEPKIQSSLAFRGGTSLQKLFLPEPTRYSEDIDLVQIPKESIGETIDLIKSKLDPWLKKPQIDFKTGRVTIRYKYTSEIEPVEIMKLKIETNNAEHFSVMGYKKIPFKVQSEWFNGQCEITTFHLEEIMGTKLRALYQRKKGRDLYDFAQGKRFILS